MNLVGFILKVCPQHLCKNSTFLLSHTYSPTISSENNEISISTDHIINISELNNLRDSFWNTMYLEDKVIWPIIYQACVFDHQKAEIYLANNNLSTQKGCINNIVDFKGKVYHIPNYCINEPYFELELLKENEIHNEEIEIHLLDINNGKTETIKISESAKGKEIKERFTSLHNIDRLNNTIHLLFGGGIIKDNESLYQHKVKNGYGVQVCIVPNLV